MKNLVNGTIIIATLSLALGYAVSPLWLGNVVVIGLGLIWLVGPRHRLSWLTDLGFISLTTMAAFGVWGALSASWMLLGVVAALMAWDLDRFSRRLAEAMQPEREAQLWRSHLRRLLPVAGLGLLLGGVAMSAELELSLSWAILLGLLVLIGLSRTIGAGRTECD